MRFCVYRKFENKIKENLLCNIYPDNFEFHERIDSDDRISFSFNIKENLEISLDGYYFTIVGFASKTPGCLTCLHNTQQKDVFIDCPIRKKIIPSPMKNCSFFRETEELFKT